MRYKYMYRMEVHPPLRANAWIAVLGEGRDRLKNETQRTREGGGYWALTTRSPLYPPPLRTPGKELGPLCPLERGVLFLSVRQR